MVAAIVHVCKGLTAAPLQERAFRVSGVGPKKPPKKTDSVPTCLSKSGDSLHFRVLPCFQGICLLYIKHLLAKHTLFQTYKF